MTRCFQKPGLLALAFFLLLIVISCAEPAPPETSAVFSGRIMGTTYTVQLHGLSAAQQERVLEAGVLRALELVDQLMSTYKADSEISRFNALPPGEGLSMSADTLIVLKKSQQLYEQSTGAFDITVGPLVALWGFGPQEREGIIPAPEALAAAKARLNTKALRLQEGRADKSADIAVDLSAIAKGYAVDKVATFLDQRGVAHYLIEVGGELRAKGLSPRNTYWRIGIEQPDSLARSAQSTLPLVDKAVATSGDYRNYVEKDGKRYSHTIDPRSGWPIDHHVASVTVVHDEAALADAWATALMVLGQQEGQVLAQQYGLAVFWIVRNKEGFESLASAAYQQYLNGLQGQE